MSDNIRIHIGDAKDMGQRFIDAWHRAERGEAVNETNLTFLDLESLLAALTPKRLICCAMSVIIRLLISRLWLRICTAITRTSTRTCGNSPGWGFYPDPLSTLSPHSPRWMRGLCFERIRAAPDRKEGMPMDQQEYANVWDALSDTPEESAKMTMRSNLLIALEQKVKSWEVTQAEAARRLGVTQPRLNELLRGKIDKFSLDKLINLAIHAGISVRLDIAA